MLILDGVVTLMNNRAITIYLWHNLLLVAAVPLIDLRWDPTHSEAVPWLLEGEDLSARRSPRMWPVGSGPAPVSA
ncbi:MAG: hypothetical protein M3536_06790 [Actinomycetota bacterium]|nr:hypothetical protein [Actinomycetota bacterium]